MRFEEVPVSEIEVEERRREDFRNIAGLAAGIKRVGVLSPILLDQNGSGRYRLVYGERRLRAVKMLGLKTIPALLRAHLSDEEFRDIELEENDNREALTDGERARTFESAKKLVEDAKKAAAARQNSPGAGELKRGPKPADGVSRAEKAKDLGVGEETLRRAEQQVETAEEFPFMKGRMWKQSNVLAVRERLAELPEAERAPAVNVLSTAKLMDPPLAVDLLDKLRAKKPAERKEIYALSQSDSEHERELALTKCADLPPMPDPRLGHIDAAVGALRQASACTGRDGRRDREAQIIDARIMSAIQELRAIRAAIKGLPEPEKKKGVIQ